MSPHGPSAQKTNQSAHKTTAKPTIVIVHGAFTDASSWLGMSGHALFGHGHGVIERLQQHGFTVLAPPNPLRGVRAGRNREVDNPHDEHGQSRKRESGDQTGPHSVDNAQPCDQ